MDGHDRFAPGSTTPARCWSRATIVLSFTLGFFLVACGSRPPAHTHTEPLSAVQHEEQAKSHEAQAQVDRERVESAERGEEVQCVDTGGPLNSGGESMPVMRPCWTKAEENAAHLRAVQRQRKAAAEHREWAQLLREAEAEACEPLSQSERDTSPFMRSADILSVEEYREDGNLMGARVAFRKVPGLSPDWLRSSIRCHQARAAKIGYDENFMPHCPLVLERVGTSVSENDDQIVVTLRSTDPVVASQVYGRALQSKNPSH